VHPEGNAIYSHNYSGKLECYKFGVEGFTEVLSDIQSMISIRANRKKVGVLWRNSAQKVFFSQLEGDKEIDRKPIASDLYYINELSFSGDKLMILENSYTSIPKILYFNDKEQEFPDEFPFKVFKNIKSNYPFIFFQYGSHEIWMIDILNPNKIRRFFTEGTIVA